MTLDRSQWDRNRVLYKYTTAHGAYKILSDLSVKCCSPFTFNDPFDTVTEIRTEFEPEEFPKALLEEIHNLMFQQEEPVFEEETEISKMIRILRKQNINQPRRPRLKFEAIEHLVSPLVDNHRSKMEDDNREWLEFLSTWRTFCMSEVHNNLLMWAHYADHHKGAVIGFRCVPEIDSVFCAARPIQYSREIPTLGTLSQWIKHITGQERMNTDNEKKFIEMIYTKSIDWEYEREWRYALPRTGGSVQDCELRAVMSEEIHSVFLGCRMTEDTKAKLERLLANELKHVKLLHAVRSRVAFELEFEQIN